VALAERGVVDGCVNSRVPSLPAPVRLDASFQCGLVDEPLEIEAQG